MKANMGNADRLIRLIVAIALVGAWKMDWIEGTLATVALVVAGIFALTSIVSFCPLYTLLGISTCRSKSAG